MLSECGLHLLTCAANTGGARASLSSATSPSLRAKSARTWLSSMSPFCDLLEATDEMETHLKSFLIISSHSLDWTSSCFPTALSTFISSLFIPLFFFHLFSSGSLYWFLRFSKLPEKHFDFPTWNHMNTPNFPTLKVRPLEEHLNHRGVQMEWSQDHLF